MGSILILILIHVIGDFFLQGTKLSKRKILKFPALLEHVGIYTLSFVVLSPFMLGLPILQGLLYSLITGVLHFVVDYITTRFKKKYWKINEDMYFRTIGVDQTVHFILLVVTYLVMFPNFQSITTIFERLS